VKHLGFDLAFPRFLCFFFPFVVSLLHFNYHNFLVFIASSFLSPLLPLTFFPLTRVNSFFSIPLLYLPLFPPLDSRSFHPPPPPHNLRNCEFPFFQKSGFCRCYLPVRSGNLPPAPIAPGLHGFSKEKRAFASAFPLSDTEPRPRSDPPFSFWQNARANVKRLLPSFSHDFVPPQALMRNPSPGPGTAGNWSLFLAGTSLWLMV